jgi:beta-aspartyl-peptidase (threonine type)
MKYPILFLLLILCCAAYTGRASDSASRFVLVVHGGAGAMGGLSAERQAAYQAGLSRALSAGYAILKTGGTALDAVTASIRVLEDDSLFNAGRGAVFTYDGRNELDASIMDGSNLKAGAVAGVTTVRNPITAARAVMEQSPHVMLAGKGAEQFAAAHGCTIVRPAYFYTTARWNDLQRAKKSIDEKAKREKDSLKKTGSLAPEQHDWKFGTVGAVALDSRGNMAAGTSTGGMTAKRWNRIGDSPVIGAGTFADNNYCAVSCTGWGEYFIRLSMARSVSDRMELAGESLEQAAQTMIHKKLPALGGDGGLISVDRTGKIAMPFNTKGMFRGYIREDGQAHTAIYAE